MRYGFAVGDDAYILEEEERKKSITDYTQSRCLRLTRPLRKTAALLMTMLAFWLVRKKDNARQAKTDGCRSTVYWPIT